MTDWTDKEKERLRRLWQTGMSASRIAAAMGRTKNSIIGAAHRMQLYRRSAQPQQPKPPKPPQVKRRVNTSPPKQTLSPLPVVQRAVPVIAPLRPSVVPQRTTARKCKWPMWGHRDQPTHVYCDQPVRLRRDGTPCVYCARHAAIAYVLVGEDALCARRL